MSETLLIRLEEKIDSAIETIELLRLQVEELEEKNAILQNENATMKGRQSQWEQGLTKLLSKLDEATPPPSASKTVNTPFEPLESEETKALA